MVNDRRVSCLVSIVCSLFASSLIASSAVAQITTGTISGSVKDGQGGVVPGAPVSLVNAERGSTTDATTNTQGDFVFPNVTPGTYTLRVALEGFKTVERPGIVVSPGDRILVPALTIEVGALTDTVTVKAETPVIQASSGERSFTISTESVANLPIADRNFATLASLAPGRHRHQPHGDRRRRRRRQQLHDGRRVDDGHRQQPAADRGERRVDRRSQGARRRATRPSTGGRAACRSPPSPRAAPTASADRSTTSSATPTGTPTARTNNLNGDPKTVSKQRDWGYSIGGPIGKPGGNNKLFFFYTQEFQPRTGGNNVVSATACRPRSSARATSRRRPTTTATPYQPAFAIAATGTALHGGRTRAAASRTAACSAGFPPSRLYQTGLEHPEDVPAAEHRRPRRARPTTTRSPGRPRACWRTSRRSASTTSRRRSCGRTRSSTPAGRSGSRPSTARIPGFNDTRMQNPVVSTMAATVNYNLNPTMFLEGTYGQQRERAGGLRAAAAAARTSAPARSR